MGSEYYGKMWVATCADLDNLILREKLTRNCNQQNVRRLAHSIFVSIYIRYVFAVNALSDIYDQTLQVQKRTVVKTILTLATKRMLELQTDLKKIEMSEYMYLDHTLIENKLIPSEVQLLTPFYYPAQRPDEIDDLLNGVRHSDKPKDNEGASETQKKSIKHMMEASKLISPEEQRKLDERKALINAINVIKSHEKAR